MKLNSVVKLGFAVKRKNRFAKMQKFWHFFFAFHSLKSFSRKNAKISQKNSELKINAKFLQKNHLKIRNTKTHGFCGNLHEKIAKFGIFAKFCFFFLFSLHSFSRNLAFLCIFSQNISFTANPTVNALC